MVGIILVVIGPKMLPVQMLLLQTLLMHVVVKP